MFTAENVLHRMYDAPYQMLDPGDGKTIWVNRQFATVPMVSAAAETRTLARPTKAGVVVTLLLKTYAAGAITVTVTGGYNQAADTAIIFNTTGDWVQLQSQMNDDVYCWRVVASEGVALTGVENAFGGVTAGTVTASKGLVVDANKALDELVVSKLRLAITAVTAVGSVQSLATNTLSYGLNVVKGGGTDLGLTLPTPLTGGVVVVKNNTASAAIVYPGGVASTSIINALATTTGVSVATLKSHTFICENSTQWWTLPLAIA